MGSSFFLIYFYRIYAYYYYAEIDGCSFFRNLMLLDYDLPVAKLQNCARFQFYSNSVYVCHGRLISVNKELRMVQTWAIFRPILSASYLPQVVIVYLVSIAWYVLLLYNCVLKLLRWNTREMTYTPQVTPFFINGSS